MTRNLDAPETSESNSTRTTGRFGTRRRRFVVIIVAVAMVAGGVVLTSQLLSTGGGTDEIPLMPVGVVGEKRNLPDDWLGVNGANLRSGRELWSDDKFFEAVRSLGPSNIRVFGGSTANYWDWRTGNFVDVIGVPDDIRRARRSPENVEMEEWATLLEQTSSSPVYVLNMVTSSLDDQLQMLAKATELGMPVKRVELGNELWSNEELVVKAFPTAEAYADAVNLWSGAIKAQYPDAETGAVGFCGVRGTNKRKTEWNAAVVPRLVGVDAITCHPYVQSGLGATPDLDTDAAMATLMKSVDDRVGTVVDILGGLPPGLEVWATEWNLLDQEAPVHGTWAQGLAAARMGLGLAQTTRITLANFHSLVGSGTFSALYGGESGLDFGERAEGGEGFLGPSNPEPTELLQRSAAGEALALLFRGVSDANQTQEISLGGTGPDAEARRAIFAQLFTTSSGTTRGLFINARSSPLTVKLDGLPLAAASSYSQVSGAPSTMTSQSEQLTVRNDSVKNARVVLAPFSVTLVETAPGNSAG